MSWLDWATLTPPAPNKNNSDEYTILYLGFGILLFIGIIGSIIFPIPIDNKPKVSITAESVGKATGRTATKFTKGVIKGTWEAIRGK